LNDDHPPAPAPQHASSGRAVPASSARTRAPGLRSQLADLESKLTEYDALRQGRIATPIPGIGPARTVRNLTHKVLAQRLSRAERQAASVLFEAMTRLGFHQAQHATADASFHLHVKK